MYERTRGEQIVLVADVATTETALSGLEQTVCHLKKAGVNCAAATGAAVALSMAGTYNAASGGDPANFTFAGSSAVLMPGVYVFEGWVRIGGQWVSLGGSLLRIKAATAELPA